MKIFWALLASFAIHFVIFLLLQQDTTIVENTSNMHKKQNQQNTTIRFVKLFQQPSLQPKQTEQHKIVENKQSPNFQKDEIVPKNNLANIPISEVIIPIKIPQKPVINESPKDNKTNDTKEVGQQEIKQEIRQENQIDNVTKSYLELYRDDFDKFSDETKIFLVKNIKDIGRVTERFLIYPHIGIQARQQGINVVEFWLYPDGKISKPKIIKSSNYYILDDNTEETILKAYKDYPRPDKPTVIRIYVRYKLI